MPPALNLTVRQPVEVLRLVAEFFAGEPGSEIVFEGDISAIDWASVPGAQVDENRREAVVPLTDDSVATLVQAVFPRIGLRSRVWHVIVRRDGQRLFASYDSFGDGMVVVEARERDLVRERLQAAGLLVACRETSIDG